MYIYVYVYIWNTYRCSSYVYVCIYIHTHTHTMEYLLSHKKEQNCVISRDVDGLETLIQSKVCQNEERFSDRENRWQAK